MYSASITSKAHVFWRRVRSFISRWLSKGGSLEVMEIGPVFRAEKSFTARHLTEFTGLDLEMEIEHDYHEVVDLLEALMLFIFRGLEERLQQGDGADRQGLSSAAIQAAAKCATTSL